MPNINVDEPALVYRDSLSSLAAQILAAKEDLSNMSYDEALCKFQETTEQLYAVASGKDAPMSVTEAIELFAHEMKNEIIHSSATGILEDSLFKAVDDVQEIVVKAFYAKGKRKL